jgi:hypothetical protein
MEPGRHFAFALAAFGVAAAALVLISRGSENERAVRHVQQRVGISENVAVALPAAPRPFSPTSFWNSPLEASAALDPRSSELMKAFREAIAGERGAGEEPSLNTSRWSVPVYRVGASQPTVRVKLDRSYRSPALQGAWDKVPLPPDAHPASGTDRHLVVWQPSSDRLWEFWRMSHAETGWRAAWGGAMEHVSTDPGVYGPSAWPGATRAWGASASSLSIAGGLVTIADIESGRIEHALAMAYPDVREGVYSLPAHRTDGIVASRMVLPEGAHLRLDPKLDLSTLQLPRLTRMIAEAAQKYGIFLRSRAGHVVLYGQDPTPTASDPYTGLGGYFEGLDAGEILASFPWNHLQLLAMSLHYE